MTSLNEASAHCLGGVDTENKCWSPFDRAVFGTIEVMRILRAVGAVLDFEYSKGSEANSL